MNSEKSHLIEKKILYAGTEKINFNEGTKVHFHFQTWICDKNKTLLDDSKKMGNGKPVELIIGKKFKFEVWESFLKGMRLNEVSSFTVDTSLVYQYPFVSKTLRDAHKPQEQRYNSHCCAMSLQTEKMGYDDLNEYLKQPKDLEFIMEIVKVEQPDSYEKETWQMSESELLELIPKLKEQGNEQYKLHNYKDASELYSKAIGILELLMVKEKPHDEDWNKLNDQKMLILLNYSQCLLHEGDFYKTIEHCTTVLGSCKDNVKAYYRRAKAYVGAWDPEKAKKDFLKVLELDQTMEPAITKELNNLEKLIKLKENDDKQRLRKLFS